MRDLWLRFLSWYTGEPKEFLACPTNHAFKDARLRLLPEENANDYYEQCLDCGKEFHSA